MSPEARFQTIQKTLASILGVEEKLIQEDSSPDTLAGWDSVNHLNIVMALEEASGTSFTPEETMEMTSVKLIALLLEEKGC